MPLVKNQQFLSNQADIQAVLPTLELVVLTKFHKDWQKIVDFFRNNEILIQSYFSLHQSLAVLAIPPDKNKP